MGFVGDQSGDALIVQNLIVVLIQGCNGKAKGTKDSCEAIDSSISVGDSLFNPLGVGESLKGEIVGESSPEYRQVGTATRKDEARAATLLKDGLGLRLWSAGVQQCLKVTNLIQDKKLSKRICRLKRRVGPSFTESMRVPDADEGNITFANLFVDKATWNACNCLWQLPYVSVQYFCEEWA